MNLSIATAILRNGDPVMREIVDSIDLPEIETTEDVFFDLVTCILEQQIHYRARGIYIKKFMELTESQLPTPELILLLDSHAFSLKKIAANKLKALQNLSNYWIAHHLEAVEWSQCSVEEVREYLKPIKGIGEWTIDMILLFTLGKPDIFSPNDFQLKKVMMASYGLAEDSKLTKEMTSLAENWKPYRSIATRYLLEWGKYLKKR